MYSKLLIFFICVSFAMMILTMFCLGSIVLILFRFEVISPEREHAFFPILFAMFFSVLTGTVISGIVAQRILSPISELRKSMSLVAHGNFSQKMDDQATVEEIHYLIRDFNQMIEELNSIETLRNDFISSVSHEFKTPLSVIRGYVQLLQEPDLSEQQQQRYIQQILEATKKLSQLTGNILQLNKLENQVLGLETDFFQLDEQIRKIIVMLQPKWEAKEIYFDVVLPHTIFCGNEELLFHVWLNLIDNAINYSDYQGLIKIELTEKEQIILCKIEDNGIGIDSNHLKHIFDKFYQVEKSRSSQGNGLGLTLVNRIVELHHGKINVSSEKKKGTVFEVRLPKYSEGIINEF